MLNTDRFIELVVNRSALPRAMPLLLALDSENVWFPEVDVDSAVEHGPGLPGRDHDCGCDSGLLFLDRTRVRTSFGCCEGVLTMEKGSRFDCIPCRRVLGVDVVGGDVIVRGTKRFVQINADVAVIRLEKASGQLLPLALETRAPASVPKGREWEISVAQRDTERRVVGGASVLFVRA